MPLLNQANHAIWQKSWSTSIVLTVFPWKRMPPKEKKSFSVFVHDSKTKEDDKIVLQRVGFEISRERQGLLLQSRKMAKRWQSSWKTIETTAESSLTSFLASGTSFFGREAVRQATKKIGRRTVLKVYCSGREASRKTPGSGFFFCYQYFQGSIELLENVSHKSWLGSTWLVRCKNENCTLQISNNAF